MGWGRVIAGGPDGRYTIELDLGEAQRVAIAQAFSQKVAATEQKIIEVQAAIAAHDALVAQSATNLQALLDSIIAAQEEGPGGGVEAASRAYASALSLHLALVAQGAPNRILLAQLKVIRAEAARNVTAFQQLRTLDVRQAWCADFTENGGGYVGTIEIPGEPSLVLVAPGARVPVLEIDGTLLAREVMSPEQAYFNAAILPGWQRFLPTYRWGTLTGIDWDADTGDVTLGAANSSAQRLDTNDRATLERVPIEYMQTNARAFDSDSRVVVDLRGGWDAPRIIGFLDNPRPDPPTLTGEIGGANYTEGDAVSADLSIYWTGGAEPLTYELIQGTLPAGLSLASSTGILSGTPSAPGTSSGLVVRCSDKFFDLGKNRRYEDSNPFEIQVYGGWTFTDQALDVVAATDNEYIYVYVTWSILDEAMTGFDVGDGRVSCRFESWPVGGGIETFVDDAKWCTGGDLPGFPDLWYSVEQTGTPQWVTGGLDPGEWYPSIGAVEWNFVAGFSGLPPGTYSIEYTIKIATDSEGAHVVATISGSIEATLTDPL